MWRWSAPALPPSLPPLSVARDRRCLEHESAGARLAVITIRRVRPYQTAAVSRAAWPSSSGSARPRQDPPSLEQTAAAAEHRNPASPDRHRKPRAPPALRHVAGGGRRPSRTHAAQRTGDSPCRSTPRSMSIHPSDDPPRAPPLADRLRPTPPRPVSVSVPCRSRSGSRSPRHSVRTGSDLIHLIIAPPPSCWAGKERAMQGIDPRPPPHVPKPR